MPPVAVAAGITAAGALAGGILNAHAAGKGYDAQLKAQQETLAFEREREAERRRDEEERRRLAQQQWEAYQAYRQPYRDAGASILAQYGITGGFAAPPQQAPEGWTPPAPGSGRRNSGPVDYSGFSLGRSPTEGMLAPQVAPYSFTLGGF